MLDSRSAGGPAQNFALSLAGSVPADAVAVAVNLTATQEGAAGFVTAYPCGTALPLVSNVNFGAGQTVPNSAVVPIGANRSICFYASTPVQIIVDLAGSFGPTGSSLTTVMPTRLLDTRNGTGGWYGVLGNTQTIDLAVGGHGGRTGQRLGGGPQRHGRQRRRPRLSDRVPLRRRRPPDVKPQLHDR